MRIVIDMQGAQSDGSRDRGIGRYSLSLAKAIARNRGDHEIFLALNGLFPESIEVIRSAFDGLLPQQNIRVWFAPGPVSNINKANDWRRLCAELVREAFLASLKPDVLLISSLAEGLTDDAVTSVGELSNGVPTAVILYDLIPLIYRQYYLQNPMVARWFESKLNHLRRADLLLAISESSRQEGILNLDFSAEACISISTAIEPQFQQKQINSEQEEDLRQRYGLQHSFVMYTGGIDYRKNIEGLIRAYASLPISLRGSHQLAIVCAINSSSRSALEALAKDQGLETDELVLTGFVPEEDLLMLYNLCKMFVFPSWHEGFGLPALEAMACGRAVIGANTSSLPEVIGRYDALFDPKSDTAIAKKLAQVLTDDAYRFELEQHGLEQAKRFSWDITAQRAITALETLHSKKISQSLADCMPTRRLKLAYISPLPPERSGISDYSAELLPALSRHYEIDVIVAQDSVSDPWITGNCSIHNVDWFREHAADYDRVLYHFGNSHFHQHMFSLLDDVPGVVILHDFFLSGIVAHMDFTGFKPGFWGSTLYKGHGYTAMRQRFHTPDTGKVVWQYPCSQEVIMGAMGVIVHSENSRRLSNEWYGNGSADDWAVIPHLRVPESRVDRSEARRQLKLSDADFVVCSFGLLGPTKLNHRLLDGWLASDLAKNPNCILVFVGENQNGEYCSNLVASIRESGLDQRIRITGWADTNSFRCYLAAADVGVQLRTLSRGETSGTVLDCMNYGLPTIVNSNGSMVDLPDNGVWKLPDEFTDYELIRAMEVLWREPARRQELGARAREIILTSHNPECCAVQYVTAIEDVYKQLLNEPHTLIGALARVESPPTEVRELISLAQAIDHSIPPRLVFRQLLVDISEIVQADAKSGIQRVVHRILLELLMHPPEGLKVEPVYATTSQPGYRYARCFTLKLLNCPESALSDDIVEFRSGDIFLGLDMQPSVVSAQQAFYNKLRIQGVQVQFVIYDLLPITLPNTFTKDVRKSYQAFIEVVAESDGAICISKSVADELKDWMGENKTIRQRPFNIAWFHLGADFDPSFSSKGLQKNSEVVLSIIKNRPTFLMVGTLEPRKGHAQTIAAFDQLWSEGVNFNLVIVGKQGWMVDALVKRLQHHHELSKRLLWLDDVSDEYLEKIYASSTCLIAASLGEGFGLPLIEAAQHKLPIIARDIQVFREVAGESAFYYSGLDPIALAEAIKHWMQLEAEGDAPQTDNMPWLTWKQSTQQLKSLLIADHPKNESSLKVSI